jgi:hypothetical protein
MNQVAHEPSILLVQSESETRMHRVLYLLQSTRAFTLYSVWYMATLAVGVSGLYPSTDQTRAELNNMAVDSALKDFLTFAIPLYMCISITRVFKKNLKLQSLFCLFVAAIFFLAAITQFKFSRFSILFAALLALEFILVCWLAFDTAIGLWKVSRTPEVSSFHATLDPRLARGLWGLANKLLDLPRTPLRSWRAFGAYLLAFAGSVGFAVSFSYALSLGGVVSEYFELDAKCRVITSDQCYELSKGWGTSSLVWLLVSIVGIKLAIIVQSSAKRFGAIPAHDILKMPGEKYILYLRSFGTDDVRLLRPRLPLLSRLMSPWPFPVRVEEELFDVADGYLPLVAIGRPGDSSQDAGGLAYREYLSDDDWQAYIEDKIQKAERIVMLLNTTHGVLWELDHVLALGAGPKALFLFDPKARDVEAWRSIKDAMIPSFVRAGLMPPMFAFLGQALAFYFIAGKVVQIENSNWSVSSYRTAFSHFLAERA